MKAKHTKPKKKVAAPKQSKHVRFDTRVAPRHKQVCAIRPGNFWAEGDEWIVAQRKKKAVPAFRPRESQSVKRYIGGKLGITRIDMFDAVSAKTLGRSYAVVRRECGEGDGDGEKGMKKKLIEEEAAQKRFVRNLKENMCGEDKKAFEREEAAYNHEQMKRLGRFIEEAGSVNRKNVYRKEGEKYVLAAVERRAYDVCGRRRRRRGKK